MGALKSFANHIRYLLTGNAPEKPIEGVKRLICKRCGSHDTWRVQADSGWYAEFMRSRGLKPFECRMCKKRFYHRAIRKDF